MTTETKLAALLARWKSGDGKPYKGQLVDWDAYEADPESISCFCAQGQVLHQIGGWEPQLLQSTSQPDADAATAKLLNISTAHAILLRNVNDSMNGAPAIVLTDPGKVLGGKWSRLLDFWWHMDQMTDEQKAAARDAALDAAWAAAWAAARAAAWDAAWDAARAAAWDAARDAALDAARAAAWDAARAAAWDAARAAAGYAASEIQGAPLLRKRGKAFYFLPMFGFADPESIPARPVNYGELVA